MSFARALDIAVPFATVMVSAFVVGFGAVWLAMHNGFAQIRSEIADVRREIGDLRTELHGLVDPSSGGGIAAGREHSPAHLSLPVVMPGLVPGMTVGESGRQGRRRNQTGQQRLKAGVTPGRGARRAHCRTRRSPTGAYPGAILAIVERRAGFARLTPRDFRPPQ